MYENNIIIRPAENSDISSIWELLHADSKKLTIEMIEKKLNNLFVLSYRNRILGVFYGKISLNNNEPCWVTVHPLYPESTISNAIFNALLGVLSRQPVV